MEGVGVGPALSQRATRLPRPLQIGRGKVTDPRLPRLVKHRRLIRGRRMAMITSFFDVCPSFDGFETIPKMKKNVLNSTIFQVAELLVLVMSLRTYYELDSLSTFNLYF